MNPTEAKTYRGVDYAIVQTNHGEAFVQDDGEVLIACRSYDGFASRCAIDCPLGTSAGFFDLLTGRTPSPSNDHFQFRETERWAKGHVDNKFRVAAIRFGPGRRLFNRGGHVKATTMLTTVPSGLNFVLEQTALLASSPQGPEQTLISARRGEGHFVEAHPRLFLYSVLERVHQATPGACNPDILNDAATYKRGAKKEAAEKRSRLYAFLLKYQAWMGPQQRRLEPQEAPDWLVDNDHNFDAWLCALTAWAHDHSETLDWRAARIPEEIVDIEGHMLLLST